MALKAAIAAISVARAAFAACWRPVLDALPDGSPAREIMFRVERDLSEVEALLRHGG